MARAKLITVDIVFLADLEKTTTVVLHPIDDMIARRDFDKPEWSWACDDDLLHYRCWLACKREHIPGADTTFESWFATVADVDPVLSDKEIDEALARKQIPPEVAEMWRSELRERQGSGRGESQAPPT